MEGMETMLDLIRKAIRDIEALNDFKLGEKSWARLKQLDREIGVRVHLWEKEWAKAKPYNQSTIVCLCGSTRFEEAYDLATAKETLKGNIVLSIGVNLRKQRHISMALGIGPQSIKAQDEKMDRVKAELDELHLRKIDLADEILILNVDGYVGKSTRREIEYARSKGKVIRWWEPDKVPEDLRND